jgi:hypothetical protein
MEYIRQMLKKAYLAQQDGHDSVFIITGNEGFGKSHLLLNIAEEWGKITGQELGIEAIGLDKESWINSLKVAPEISGFSAFDEAGDGLLSRDAMGDFNKDMVKMYSVIRGRRLMSILVLPSFWYLDKFFRQHRLKGLFFVYNRGVVAFWNKRQIKQLIDKGEDRQNIWAVKPSIRDRFPKYNGRLLKEYEEKKKEKIQNTIDEVYAKYGKQGVESLTDKQREVYELRQSGMTQHQIADQLGITQGSVMDTIKLIRKKRVTGV